MLTRGVFLARQDSYRTSCPAVLRKNYMHAFITDLRANPDKASSLCRDEGRWTRYDKKAFLLLPAMGTAGSRDGAQSRSQVASDGIACC